MIIRLDFTGVIGRNQGGITMKKLFMLLIIANVTLLGIIVYININNKKIISDENSNIINTKNSKIYDEYGKLNPLDPYYKAIKENKNYKIYEDKSGFNYSYTVFNNEGEILDSGFNTSGIKFAFNNKLLELQIDAGTYATIYRYYDLVNSRVSKYYVTPLGIGGEYVAYFKNTTTENKDNIFLVIQNIFDKNIYYKEIKRDFSSMVLGGETPTEFINNNTQIKISYPISPNDEIVTETINL
jgi:hypothetical protein